jgi:uncharacterized protein (TIGR02217 family)
MADLTTRFPDDIARGAEGGWAGWLVTIVSHAGGTETPNLDDPHPIGRWNVSRALERLNKHETARRHFIMARGKFHRFRFKDWSDFRCARTGSDRGELVGAGTSWQLTKTYAADDATFKYRRELNRIVAGSQRIWRNGSLQTLTTHYTINSDTGVLTSAASWTGDTLEMSCEFDVLARYDVERLVASLEYRLSEADLLHRWADIDIVEARE